MKIIIETDGSTIKCEVNNKNIKDCDVLTKNLAFNAFKIIIDREFNKIRKYLGRIYKPNDNSYCINIKTGISAGIVPGACINEELNAEFRIVKSPYKEKVTFHGKHEYTFVNVKSDKTGNVYRVLFNERNMHK